jgi:acyl carrier protein
LPALPLNANGKIDRRALAAIESVPADSDRYVEPQTPVEETLAEIWSGVLQLNRVGIHDNFFDLGGHSLLATQALWRVRSAFDIDLPLRALFESPTVAALAQVIEAALLDRVDVRELDELIAEVLAMPEDEISSPA